MLTCQISSRSVHSVALWRRKTQNFAIFALRHFAVSLIRSNLRKLNTSAQLQTFPYPTTSKSFLYSNAFMAKSGIHSLRFNSVTDRQTNRQKTQRFWPPRRRVKSADGCEIWRRTLFRDKFHPIGATCRPRGAKKPQNRPLSNLNTGAWRCAQCCR